MCLTGCLCGRLKAVESKVDRTKRAGTCVDVATVTTLFASVSDYGSKA